MKLTKTAVEKAALPDSGFRIIWDDAVTGFGCRVTAAGNRSYIVQARVDGKTRKTTLGKHGVLTVDQARTKAKTVLGDMAGGVNPTAQKRRAKALSITLREVMEDYFRDRRDLKPRSKKDIQRHVEVSFEPWSDKPIVAITRNKVTRRFRELSDRSPAQANQAMRNLRALMNYARAQYRTGDDEPIIGENPVDVLSQARMWHKSKTKNGYVPINQIGRWWSHVEALRADPSLFEASRAAADLVAFLALTGLRISEARALRWEQVDLEDASLTLHDTKNRDDVTLPLSKQAVELLRGRGDGDYVFPARSGDGYMLDVRGTIEKLAEIAGLRVTPHDIRRTFRAVAGENNVELWRTKALMNHKQNHDVTLKHYTDLSDVRYLRPEAEAIGGWIERQRQIAEADNVVSMEAMA